MVTNITEILIYLMSGGGAGALVSFIGERIPAYHELTPENKRGVMIIVTILVAILSWGILKYVPPETLSQWNEPVMIIFGIIATYTGNQLFHKHDPIRKK